MNLPSFEPQSGWSAFVEGLAAILGSVPAAAWTAAIGAGFTLLGVLIANRNNDRRHRIELEQGARLHNQKLKADFRKEVYLAAASSLVSAEQHLVGLNSSTNNDPQPFVGLQPLRLSVAQMSMVSSAKVSIAIGEVYEAYSHYLLDEMANLQALRSANTEVQFLKSRIIEAREERKRIIRDQQKIQEAGQPDIARSAGLQGTHDLFVRWQKEDEEALGKAENYAVPLTVVQTERMFSTIDRVSKAALTAQLGIREEIGMQPDLTEFEHAYRARLERMRQRTLKILSDLGMERETDETSDKKEGGG